MNNASLRQLAVCAVLIVIIAACAYVVMGYLAESSQLTSRFGLMIELRKDGFYPEELHIRKGDTVQFITSVDASFWPASDPHPVHDIYPGFDPGEPIQPSSSWSFTFDNEGTYRFHDHLSPERQGVIIVGDDRDVMAFRSVQECEALTSDSQKRTCFEFLLLHTLDAEGLQAGFALFRSLADLEPQDCHQYAHDLGEYAYDVFASRETFELGPEATYCGYGFWHGFMTRMSSESGIDGAKGFCASIDKKSAGLTTEAQSNCFHGVGIGLMPDPPPYELWGRSGPLVEPALRYCDAIEGENSSHNCYSGVFHAVVNYMIDGRYGFRLDEKRPFSLCENETAPHRKQCRFQVAPRLAGKTGHDIDATLALLPYTEDKDEYENMVNLALVNFIERGMTTDEHMRFINRCLTRVDVALCMKAVIHSLFTGGTPGKEYEPALRLCGAQGLPESTRRLCVTRLAFEASRYYDTAKFDRICASIEPEFPAVCRNLPLN